MGYKIRFVDGRYAVFNVKGTRITSFPRKKEAEKWVQTRVNEYHNV